MAYPSLSSLCVASLSLLWASSALSEEFSAEAKQELQRLQGEWRVVRTERAGKEEPPPAEPVKILVQGDKFLLGDRDLGLRIATLTLATKPKLLDVTQPDAEKKFEAVYELTDDLWKICVNSEGTAERPADFNTASSSKYVTVHLERIKEK